MQTLEGPIGGKPRGTVPRMSCIRRATQDDIPSLVRMARHFIKYAPHSALMEPNEEELVAQSRMIVDTPMFGVFVADVDGELVAMFVAVIGPVWFSPSRMMASELAWWVEPHARNTPIAFRLLKAYEDWAKENNADCMFMASLEMDHGPNVERMLTRFGYAKSETQYFKGTQT